MPKERGGTGQYVETVTHPDVLGVFERVRGPVVTSADVADALGCSRDTARRKLTELHQEGRVERRKTAARVVWWLADPETRLKRLSVELGEPITVGERVFEAGDSHAIRNVRTQSRETREDDADALDALHLDDERRAAVAAMYDLLREQGTARKADFTGDVYPEHPAGFGTPDGWWNALGSGSTATGEKGSLGDLPGVRKPPSSGRPTWEYVGG